MNDRRTANLNKAFCFHIPLCMCARAVRLKQINECFCIYRRQTTAAAPFSYAGNITVTHSRNIILPREREQITLSIHRVNRPMRTIPYTKHHSERRIRLAIYSL